MLFAEKEANIIESFQMLNSTEILLLPETDAVESILSSIIDIQKWKLWTDSSNKSAPPPDFYCDSMKLMMEVMRVDDHGYKKKGKITNPTLVREHQIEKELREKGILDMSPHATLFINAVTDLPTVEDHNYLYYRANFARTVAEHTKKIPNYRKNHPGYQLIFFVFDESSMYFEVEEENKVIKQGEQFAGFPHKWLIDADFLSAFENSGVDYLIWFTPYKWVERMNPPLELPKACVFDCKNMILDRQEYDPKHMMSAEE